MTDRNIRVRTLELNGTRVRNIKFSEEEEKTSFSLIDGFGVPVGNLEAIYRNEWIRQKQSKVFNLVFQWTTIDKDKSDELSRWIYNARSASAELKNSDMKFAIKGDAKLEYPQIKRVMDILQDQDVNSFNLVTGLRGKDF